MELHLSSIMHIPGDEGGSERYTPHPAHCTLHLTSHTLHPTPCTIHPTPCTPHPTPHTPHPAPHTRSGGRGFGFGSNQFGQLLTEFNAGTGNANPIPLEIDLSLLRSTLDPAP